MKAGQKKQAAELIHELNDLMDKQTSRVKYLEIHSIAVGVMYSGYIFLLYLNSKLNIVFSLFMALLLALAAGGIPLAFRNPKTTILSEMELQAKLVELGLEKPEPTKPAEPTAETLEVTPETNESQEGEGWPASELAAVETASAQMTNDVVPW